MTPRADNAFDEVVAPGWHGWTVGRLSIHNDPRAPLSPSGVGRAEYGPRFVGGRGPINLGSPAFSDRVVYIHMGLMFSDPWDGHSSGTNKVFFTEDAGSHSDVFMRIEGTGRGTLNIGMATQNVPGSRNYRYDTQGNQVRASLRDATLTRGQWRDIEIIIDTGSGHGSRDGALHMWVDGVKILQFTGIATTRSEGGSALTQIRWNPTWGGGNVDTTELGPQYQYIDHIYISGR